VPYPNQLVRSWGEFWSLSRPTTNSTRSLKFWARVQRSVPSAQILIVDDNSPDGTGKIADEWVAHNEEIHVMHRLGKGGLGAAYLAGFAWGLQQGFDVLVEMDADGSHQPEQLPKLLKALEYSDLALGSRWVEGGGTENWSKRPRTFIQGRKLLHESDARN